MTIEMQTALEREMDDAMRIDDDARRRDAVIIAMAHQIRALIDCQRKTSDRVKVLYEAHERKKWLLGAISSVATAIMAVLAWLYNKVTANGN